jgi:zinc protease
MIFSHPAAAQESEKVLDIEKVTSPGGLTAWLVEDDSQPIIAMDFAFEGAGAVNTPADKQGLSTLLSNTLDEGAGDLTSQQFQKELSDHSITLRFSSNRDNFGGSLKTLKRHQEKAFNLLELALNEPRFDEEPVERMRQANLARLRGSMSNPDWIAARLFNDKAFEGHPYALNSGGTLTTLAAITPADLKAFKETHLTQDRLVIGVAGDITAEELGPLLDEVFGGLPKNADEEDISPLTIQNTGSVFVYERPIPQSIIMMATDSLDENDPDYYTLQVMNHIFGSSGFGSRLMEEAREKRGLTYGIYSGLANQEYVNALTISASTDNKNVPEMLSIIRQEMDKMGNSELSTELQDAKSYLTGSLPLALTSTGSIADILVALQLNDRGIDYLDQYEQKINQVNAGNVQRVAGQILDPEKLVTIIVGQPEGMKDATKIETLPNVE